MLNDVNRYRAYCEARRAYVQHPKVKKAIIEILKAHPDIQVIFLVGSYLAGDWIDENTEPLMKELKLKFKRYNRISDVDFITVPQVPSTQYYDIIPDTSIPKLVLYDKFKEKV